MQEFISNNAKFFLDYGQALLIVGILICLFIIFRIGENHKFYLPKNVFGWLGSILSFILIVLFSLAIMGLGYEKKTTGVVLNQFESMLKKEVPELTFNMVSDDASASLKDYQGKVVLLNLWATWCTPCLKEMPDLSNLQKDFKEDGLVVITLSDEPRDVLLKYQKNKPFEFLSVYNKQIEWLNINIGTARPVTFMIDRNGIITEYFTGKRDYEFFASKLNHLL